MPNSDTIDARLRSVEQTATEAAKVPGFPESGNFADANRNAEEMVELMKRRYENAGARIDALSATVKSGETAFRSEVTLDTAAAERLFGTPSRAITSSTPGRTIASKRDLMLLSIYARYASRSRNALAQELQGVVLRSNRPTLPTWMQSVLTMDANDQTAPALDEMFNQIDSMLSAGELTGVDEIVAAMPVEGPSLSLMMGLLSITRPAAERLPSRDQFFARVYRLCKAMRRDADLLLGGLK